MSEYQKININNPFENAETFFITETESTMYDARKIAESGCKNGTLIITDYQSKGKGRIDNRKWESEKSVNLLFTIILDKSDLRIDSNLVPLVCGLALSNIVDIYSNKNSFIKWPNDVLVDDKKISGILCEADTDHIYIGIGLNCNQDRFPDEIKNIGVSIKQLTGKEVDKMEIFEKLLIELKKYLYQEHEVISEISSKLYKLNDNIIFLLGDGVNSVIKKGVLVGLTEKGYLKIRTSDNKVNEYLSGELLIQ